MKGDSIVELGMEPEKFDKCRTGAHKLNGERYQMDSKTEENYTIHQSAAITILVIGYAYKVIIWSASLFHVV